MCVCVCVCFSPDVVRGLYTWEPSVSLYVVAKSGVDSVPYACDGTVS